MGYAQTVKKNRAEADALKPAYLLEGESVEGKRGANRLAWPGGYASRFFYQERMWGR